MRDEKGSRKRWKWGRGSRKGRKIGGKVEESGIVGGEKRGTDHSSTYPMETTTPKPPRAR